MLSKAYYTIDQVLQKPLIIIIKAYRYLFSPWLGNCCRFYPSCSLYSLTAIRRFGAFRGSFMMVARLLRCHPFNAGGFDPVPQKKK